MKATWLRAINFKEATTAATGEGYFALPVFKDKRQFISCWKVPFFKRIKFLFTGKVWLCLEHCEQPDAMKKIYDDKNYHQPSSMTVDCPFEKRD